MNQPLGCERLLRVSRHSTVPFYLMSAFEASNRRLLKNQCLAKYIIGLHVGLVPEIAGGRGTGRVGRLTFVSDVGIVTEGANADDLVLYRAINFFLLPLPILEGIPFILGYSCLSRVALFLCFSVFADSMSFLDCVASAVTGPSAVLRGFG